MNKIIPPRGIDPTAAKDQMLAAAREDRQLAVALAAALDIQRGSRIRLTPRHSAAAIKYIVR